MKILITGGTGFIGSQLIKRLVADKIDVIAMSRNPSAVQNKFGKRCVFYRWDTGDITSWAKAAEGCDIVVNLVGETISGLRWTNEKMDKIKSSRVEAGTALLKAIKSWQKKPQLLLQASATGYYGNREDKIDESADPGEGFLAEVSREWEASTAEIEQLGIKRAVMRIGVVLGNDGGMLQRIVTPFKLGLGGPVGDGRQGLPWVHIDDVTGAMLRLIEEDRGGVFNITAPHPVSMKEFTATLARVLHKPHFLPVPGALLKMAMGKMAEELLLSGALVFPKALLDLGYNFKYNNLYTALTDLMNVK